MGKILGRTPRELGRSRSGVFAPKQESAVPRFTATDSLVFAPVRTASYLTPLTRLLYYPSIVRRASTTKVVFTAVGDCRRSSIELEATSESCNDCVDERRCTAARRGHERPGLLNGEVVSSLHSLVRVGRRPPLSRLHLAAPSLGSGQRAFTTGRDLGRPALGCRYCLYPCPRGEYGRRAATFPGACGCGAYVGPARREC